jgi:hypothetical protein
LRVFAELSENLGAGNNAVASFDAGHRALIGLIRVNHIVG